MENEKINELPTIGVLVFDGFLANEVVAPVDVFTKASHNGEALFNVVLVSEKDKVYQSEEGLRLLPDVTMENCPELEVLVVPSSMNPEDQTHDVAIVSFIQDQYKKTGYMASHCAGAFILGEAGVANGKKIVTYCGGSEWLQNEYPKLLVQDDTVNAVVTDGKIISSNGNLVSYLASLELLEKLAGSEQRSYVEKELLIDKLK